MCSAVSPLGVPVPLLSAAWLEGMGSPGSHGLACSPCQKVRWFQMVPWSLPSSVTSVVDLWHFGTYPDPDPDPDPDLQIHTTDLWIQIRILLQILLLMSVTFTNQKIPFVFLLITYYFLKVHLHHCSKIKVIKKSENNKKPWIFLLLFLDDGRICTNNDESGNGSRRSKIIQILRIQIRFNSIVCNITRVFLLIGSVSMFLLGWITPCQKVR